MVLHYLISYEQINMIGSVNVSVVTIVPRQI